MTVHLYTGLPIAVSADTTIKFVAIAPDGTISALQEAAYDFPPPLAFSAQPSLVSGSTLAYGTYDPTADDAATEATVDTTVTAQAVLREAVTALITAGVTISSTQTMLEQVFATSQSAASASSTASRVDALVAQIQAFPTVSDILTIATATAKPQFIFTAQPTAANGVVYYGTADTEADDVVAVAGSDATVADIVTRVDQALAAAQAVPTVADLMAQMDQITATAQAEATVADQMLRAVADELLSAATSLASVADKQIMVNGVTTVAQSATSLTAVVRYLENITAAVTANATVKDVLTAMLDVGPHVRLDLISRITRCVDMLSPIKRTVDITSKVRLA